MDRVKTAPPGFTEFSQELYRRLKRIPPKSRLTVEFVTNALGEISNHRWVQSEDEGPLKIN